MDILKAETMAKEKMAEHGLNDWSFQFDSSVRRRGYCSYTQRFISLSKPLTELRTEEAVLNTILHEIAHALVGYGHGHGKVWYEQALTIGCNGERCSSDEHEPIKPKYQGQCPKCLRIVYKHRRNKIACGRCCKQYGNGKWQEAFLFKWVESR